MMCIKSCVNVCFVKVYSVCQKAAKVLLTTQAIQTDSTSRAKALRRDLE